MENTGRNNQAKFTGRYLDGSKEISDSQCEFVEKRRCQINPVSFSNALTGLMTRKKLKTFYILLSGWLLT